MAEAEAAPAPKKKSMMSVMIEFLLVTLIAAGAGFALTAMQPPPPPDKEEKLSNKLPESHEKASSACVPGPSVIEMPPIVTNVASPPDTWVRLEASIVVDPKALPNAEVIAAQIAADELAYLRTLSVHEIEGPIGLQNIRQDLRDRAAVRSQGKVVDLVLKTLVLQ